MKLVCVVCFSAAALLAAPQDAKPADKSAKAAPATEKPLTAIPSNAVAIEPGAYHWTDPKGKKWILFETPFGIAKKEDTGAPLRKKLEETDKMKLVKITEHGDTLDFERPGPFGVYKWSKKKTDLSDQEKAAWDEQQAKSKADSANRTAAKQDR